MNDVAFSVVAGVVGVVVGWFVVPPAAAWSPGTPTPLLSLRWRVGQCVATAGAVFAAALAIGAGWRAVPPLLALPAIVAASAADAVTRRLPDRLVLPSALAVGVVMVTAAAGADHLGWIGRALGGVGILTGFLLVIHVVSPAGMGFGDVKFGLILGAVLGWLHPFLAVYGLMLGSLLGALVGGVVAVLRRDRKLAIPFGPFLAAGTVIALVGGAALDVGT